ncbi:MAG TPA: hypothetical protein VIY08_00020 [Candidatus Nitrosocosmicus sp.]
MDYFLKAEEMLSMTFPSSVPLRSSVNLLCSKTRDEFFIKTVDLHLEQFAQ